MDVPDDQELVAGMVALARRLDPVGDGDGPAGTCGGPVRLAPVTEALVLRVGPVVVKAHHLRTDPAALAARLELIARPGPAEVFLPPLTPAPVLVAGRWVTAWPFGRIVEPDPDAAPWTASARLLARLHTCPVPDAPVPDAPVPDAPALAPDARTPVPDLSAGRSWPAAGGPQRAARTVAALDALAGTRLAGEAEAVRAAWWELPDRARAGTPGDGGTRLVHGDWHFGQLIADHTGAWRLSDVDDLGVGDPLWDLGRPAAFCAIGVVTAAEFGGFLDAYRAAGGPLPGPDLAWQALDVPARAYVVQTAARNLLAAHRTGTGPDEVTAELLAACRRMTRGSMTRGSHGTLRPSQR